MINHDTPDWRLVVAGEKRPQEIHSLFSSQPLFLDFAPSRLHRHIHYVRPAYLILIKHMLPVNFIKHIPWDGF